MRKNLLLLLFSISILVQLHAQLGRSLQACWVHLDKAFYVTEDVIGYQLYLSPEFKNEQTTVQIILFDADGNPRSYSYNHNQGQTNLAGNLTLDSSLSTNWYYLSFRVWDKEREREQVLLQVPIAIYNDREEIEPSEVSQQEPARWKDPVEVVNKKLQLNIRIEPENPQAGEEVRLTIQTTNRRGKPEQAALSLSINDWSQLGASLAMGMDNLHAGDSLRVITPSALTSQFYWQGLLLDQTNAPLANTEFQIQVVGKTQNLSTNTAGRFVVRSKTTTTSNSFSFSPVNGQVAKVQFMPQQGRLAMGKLFYTPAAFRYLESNRQRKSIYKILGHETEEELNIRQNLVRLETSGFTVNGFDRQQDNSWTETFSKQSPIQPSWIWQSNLQTDTNGEVTITYVQSAEPSSFRVDVIGQTAEGERARTSVVYKVE